MSSGTEGDSERLYPLERSREGGLAAKDDGKESQLGKRFTGNRRACGGRRSGL